MAKINSVGNVQSVDGSVELPGRNEADGLTLSVDADGDYVLDAGGFHDSRQYSHFIDNFRGVHNSNTYAGERRWSIGGTSTSMDRYSADDGAMGCKRIVGAAGTETRWSQYNLDIGRIRLPNVILRVRIRPGQPGDATTHSDGAVCFFIQSGTGHLPNQAAGSVTGFGIRLDSAVDTNVYAVFKNGAGSVNEDVLSFGAQDTVNWNTYEIRIGATTAKCYKNSVYVGTISDISRLDTTIPMGHVMSIGPYGGNDQKCGITLFESFIPTGGW